MALEEARPKSSDGAGQSETTEGAVEDVSQAVIGNENTAGIHKEQATSGLQGSNEANTLDDERQAGDELGTGILLNSNKGWDGGPLHVVLQSTMQAGFFKEDLTPLLAITTWLVVPAQ